MAATFCKHTKEDKQNWNLSMSNPHSYRLWFAEIARVLYSRSLFATWIFITNPLKHYNE